MDWMSPMDASFLHLEGPANPMHIGGVSIFEGPAPPFEQLEEMVAGKLDLVPRYRQKVRFVPLGLGRPVWVDDPRFNLPYHLRHSALCRRRAATTSYGARPPASSPSASTAPSRSGKSGCSKALPRAGGRSSRRSITAWSTGSLRPT